MVADDLGVCDDRKLAKAHHTGPNFWRPAQLGAVGKHLQQLLTSANDPPPTAFDLYFMLWHYASFPLRNSYV